MLLSFTATLLGQRPVSGQFRYRAVQSCYCPSVQEPWTQDGAWFLLSPWVVCKYSSERIYNLYGIFERLPDSHSSEFLSLSWLRERETLLEVLGVIRWIHQETSAFWLMKRAHSALRSHIFVIWYLLKSATPGTIRAEFLNPPGFTLLETMLGTGNRMGFPSRTPCSLIGSCKLWSQEGSTRSLCVIME